MDWHLPIGAQVEGSGTRFRVWAPDVERVEVVIVGDGGQYEVAAYALRRDDEGYHSGHVEGIHPGARYMYRLDGDKMRPDPASRYQPEGVHGPSMVVSPEFAWAEAERGWRGLPLEQAVIYEVHVGTATPEGTFEGFIHKLPYLKSLGVTAVEIMPVGDFPGDRNWGYDGVCLFAPARAYGGPEGLKRLVDAAHAQGLAVILDVVYNHLGPDGNYLRDFAAGYFNHEHKTPWGDGFNFEARPVRDFFIANAIYWAREYHVDGLRLDATHAILDSSEEHILRELARRVRESVGDGRHFIICAEDERNERWLITPASEGGAGIDAVWADDFHHEVRSAFAGDNEGYYADYTGSAADVAETLARGWFYVGQVSERKGRPRGTGASEFDPPHFVYCIQNHDQIGNRALGDRLTESVGLDAYRAASALLLLSPYTPLLFQGQEWAASTPFLFFTDHDERLGKLVTEGRRKEFEHFEGFRGAVVPDPQAIETFDASKLKWDEIRQDDHRLTLELYRELLSLRNEHPTLQQRTRQAFRSAALDTDAIAMRYAAPQDGSAHDMLIVVNIKGDLTVMLNEAGITRPPGGMRWQALLSTNEPRFGGPTECSTLQDAIGREGTLHANTPIAVVLQAVAV